MSIKLAISHNPINESLPPVARNRLWLSTAIPKHYPLWQSERALVPIVANVFPFSTDNVPFESVIKKS